MPYTRAQLDEMFEKLPNEIQGVLDSNETISFLKQIEKKYDLPLEKVQELSAEIGMLLLGASSPQRFIPNIKESMKISEETAKAIASEVNEKIFRPVKESLKQLHSLSKKEEPIRINTPSTAFVGTKKQTEIPKNEENVTNIDPYREAI